MKNILIFGVVGALALAAGYLLSGGNFGNLNDTTETKPEIVTEYKIEMKNQAPDVVVKADRVFMVKPGFLIVHELDENGSPAKLIGISQYLDAGVREIVFVTLNYSLKDGGRFIAMIHEDNGDQRFGMNEDHPAKDSSGKTVTAVFSIDKVLPPLPIHKKS